MSKEKTQKTLKDRYFISDEYCGLVYDKDTDTYFGHEASCELLNENNKKIADLEAKLAEMEAERDKLFVDLEETSNNFLNARDEWLKQLEEKDADLHQIYSHLGVEAFCEDIHEQALKEIGRLQQQLAEKEAQVKKLNLEAQKYYEDAYCNDFHNQDKISFCIEKLEQIKKFYNEYNYSDTHTTYEVLYQLDRQIKQLTHQHEDKGE